MCLWDALGNVKLLSQIYLFPFKLWVFDALGNMQGSQNIKEHLIIHKESFKESIAHTLYLKQCPPYRNWGKTQPEYSYDNAIMRKVKMTCFEGAYYITISFK